MYRVTSGFAASFLVCALGGGYAAQAQEPETFIYATYHYCDTSTQDRADEIVEQLDKPAFDAAVAGGTITGWGWMKHHTGGKWRRLEYYTAPSIEALLAAQTKIDDQVEATAKGKALGKEFRSACRAHDDYIWHRVAGSGSGRGSAVFSVYYVCDVGREDQADALIKRVYAPMYDKLVAEGKLTSWGWMEHIVGGEFRRLATMSAKDMTTLLATRGEIVGMLRDDPLSDVLSDVCGSHADYMWETTFAKP